MSIGLTKPAPPPPPIEHLNWRLRKGDRVAECRLREPPEGHEVRVTVDHELVWSKLFALNALADAPRISLEHLAKFQGLGWQRETSPPFN